jgi:hypothetical protein
MTPRLKRRAVVLFAVATGMFALPGTSMAAVQDTGVRVAEQCDGAGFQDTRTALGEVRDLLTQQPMPGVTVNLRSTEYAELALATTNTNAKGSFRFCGVPAIPGVVLQAEAEGLRSPFETLPDGRSAWSGSLYIAWSVPIDLAGHVIDAATGDPVEGAVVTVDGRGARSTTASDGGFRIAGQGAGSVSLTTVALGYSTRTDTLATTSGDRLDVRILMGVEAFELEPIVVRARSEAEFEELTMGSRFDVMTRAKVDSVLPRVMGFNSLLRSAQFPGLIVTERHHGTVCVQAHRAGASFSGGCAMVEVFLDGVRLFEAETVLANLEPGIIESMRFMDSVEASVRFMGPRVKNGVLLIETRHGTRRKR